MDIWIWHFARETLTRFTFNPGMEQYPAWTPDGVQVAFTSEHEEGGIYIGSDSAPGWSYDISPDGERFLMIKDVSSDGTSPQELILVQNWFEELERLVPTEN